MSQTYQKSLMSLQFWRLGVHFIVAFFQEFGVNARSVALFHPKNNVENIDFSKFPLVWEKPSWCEIMPDVFPDLHKELLFDGLQAAFTTRSIHSTQLTHPNDPILILFWCCFFGDCGTVEKSIQLVILEDVDEQKSFPNLFSSAFCFACDSGDLKTANAVLATGWVDLARWAGQAMAESARFGNLAIVNMLLGRPDLDFRVEPLLAWSGVEFGGGGGIVKTNLLKMAFPEITEILDTIAIFLPPNDIHKIGQLNRRCRQIARFELLSARSKFARDNFNYFVKSRNALQPSDIAHLFMFRLGVHYMTAYFNLFGVNSKTMSLCHPKSSLPLASDSPWTRQSTGYMRDMIFWSEVLPDVFPSDRRQVVFEALQHAINRKNEITSKRDDPILILLWSCFFGDRQNTEKAIRRMHEVGQELLFFPTLFTSAFFMAYQSGDVETTNVILATGGVDLRKFAGQALAATDAARLGHVEIVAMLLARSDLEYRVGHLHSSVDVAFQWAHQNGHSDVMKKIVACNVGVSELLVQQAEERGHGRGWGLRSVFI
ncbi:hypothetical protein HDU98_007214 [Podochytrium sp. JEL0797]|nr:hypothetical protein HDU98_007214 [Podochytrium sp. JEL0797]